MSHEKVLPNKPCFELESYLDNFPMQFSESTKIALKVCELVVETPSLYFLKRAQLFSKCPTQNSSFAIRRVIRLMDAMNIHASAEAIEAS
ncbi:hypothetical protein, partial [Ochrobactrum sp. S1502_03]|uniref:hypothetical protein n=1 Tax=Ochrobactrum sp. S1502_03 TaxID=3108451 RepID=UPI0037C8E0CF